MPYRHAHLWLLALLPLIALAFWPGYFGQIRAVPFALHAHGMTASAWVLLMIAQSWAIHARRRGLHRRLGLITFVVIPLFAAGGALALQGMAALWAAQADPFHAAYGARLAVSDAVAAPTVLAMVALGLRKRRDVRLHAAAMLSTVLLVLPPILGRLFPNVPGFPDAALGMTAFELSVQLGYCVALVLAVWLARDRRARLPFGLVGVATLLKMLGFATFGRAAWWEALMRAVAAVPPVALALAAMLAAAAVLYWAWRSAAGATMRPAADAV